MYPNSIYFGPKVPIQGLLSGQSIYYLGTWTLRVRGVPGLDAELLLCDFSLGFRQFGGPGELHTHRPLSSSFLWFILRIL